MPEKSGLTYLTRPASDEGLLCREKRAPLFYSPNVYSIKEKEDIIRLDALPYEVARKEKLS